MNSYNMVRILDINKHPTWSIIIMFKISFTSAIIQNLNSKLNNFSISFMSAIIQHLNAIAKEFDSRKATRILFYGP